MNDASIMSEDSENPSSSHKRRRLLLEFDDNPIGLPTACLLLLCSASSGSKHCASESQDSNQFILINVPKIVKKTKDECDLLPDSFPLPKNF